MESRYHKIQLKELALLQDLKTTLTKTKHELNNDLTRLAIKNMPIMAQTDPANPISSTETANMPQPVAGTSSSDPSTGWQVSRLSQSTVDSNDDTDNQQQRHQHQELEPLDLDL